MVLNSRTAALFGKTAGYLETINEWTGRTLAWLTLLMVLTTFTIVILRYAFNLGWIAMQESVNYMHATVFMLGAAYAYRHGAHVRVDIFYAGFSKRKKAWIDLLGNVFFLLPICAFIFWISLDYVEISWRIREGSSQTDGLPFVYLLKTVIPLMAILMTLQAVADILRKLLVLFQPTEQPD